MKRKKMVLNKKIKYALIGLAAGLIFFVASGMVTLLLPNQFFTRMTPITSLDYVFLVSSSTLLGAYAGVHYYKKNTIKECDAVATAGGIGSFFAFACPICNKLLVFLFGATALMGYFEPYKPLLGFVSNGFLAGTLYWRFKR